MCFSSSSDGKIAKQQRADEVARQARIAAGMKSINAAFDGADKGINPASAYDPAATYYKADGSKFDAASSGQTVGGPFGFSFDLPANPEAMVKAGQLFTGTEHSGGFDEGYYKKRAQDYVDYATPDLERQTKEAHDNLIYALSRNGNLDSSAAIKKNTDLTTDADAARIGIANKGLDYANQARTNVENTRSGLVAELNATGDSSAAAQSALRQSYNLNVPVGYSPLGDVFAKFAQAVGTIGSNPGNGYSGLLRGGSTLFAPKTGAQSVIAGG